MGVASMTGFARTQGEAPGISWVWEVKSVNGRALDLRLRLGPGFDALEARVARGAGRSAFAAAIFPRASRSPASPPPVLRINREALAQLVALINELTGEVEAAPPRLDGLLALRGVVETVEDEDEAVLEARRARRARRLDRGARPARGGPRRGGGADRRHAAPPARRDGDPRRRRRRPRRGSAGGAARAAAHGAGGPRRSRALGIRGARRPGSGAARRPLRHPRGIGAAARPSSSRPANCCTRARRSAGASISCARS